MAFLNLSIIIAIASCTVLFFATDCNLSSVNFIYPYIKLFSGDRATTLQAWKDSARVDDKVFYPSQHIPEIDAIHYSYSSLKEATDNFRYPAVVRGLFNGTTGLAKWTSREYLAKSFADYKIPVVRDGSVGTLQDDRVVESFQESFHALYDSEHTKRYLFFPVKSRFTFNGSEAGAADQLQDRVNEVVRNDLELDRIRPGFASPKHSTYRGSQFVIGKSPDEPTKETTGSDWHCAPGNNYFIQVVGRKRWEFIDPSFSPYMWPLKGGLFNMWTGNPNMAEAQKHVPTRYVDLNPGDMVYNPDWAWHKITNYGGLTIGVPVREANLTITLRNNVYFTSIILTAKILGKFGLSLDGYPSGGASLATEHDN